MDFPSQQLSFASSFLAKVDQCAHATFSLVEFHLAWMCVHCVCTISVPVSSYVHQLCFVWKTHYWIHLPALTLNNLLMTECSKVCHSSLSAVQLWIFLFIITYSLKKLLWWELSGAMVYRHSTMLLGGVLVLCSLSRIIVGGFPLESMTSISSISSLRFLASLTVLGMVSISRRIP